MDAGRVQPTSFGVDVRGDGVGAEDMAGEGVELRGAIPEEEGESDGREGVVVGVVGGMCEDHLFWFSFSYCSSCLSYLDFDVRNIEVSWVGF